MKRKGPGMKAPDDMRVKAVRLMRSGASDADVAKACGYSKSWARQLRVRVDSGREPELIADALTSDIGADLPPRDRRVAPPERAAASTSSAAPPAEESTDLDVSVRGQIRMLTEAIQQNKRLQRMAEADGNYSAAQKYGRDIVDASKALARLNKDLKADVSGLVLTAEDLKAADEEIEMLLEKIAQWGLLCAKCGRELRIAAAEKTEKK